MAIAYNSCRTLHNSHQRRCVTKRRYSAESIGLSHTHPFNGPLSRTTRVSRYQKGNTNLDFTEARDSEWQWHQLDHMQVCTSLQRDNHASTPPLRFLQAGCPSCCPTVSKHWRSLIMETRQQNANTKHKRSRLQYKAWHYVHPNVDFFTAALSQTMGQSHHLYTHPASTHAHTTTLIRRERSVCLTLHHS